MAISDFDRITLTLNNGGIAVIRTDTIYGIIARADNEEAVEKVYAAKNRNLSKQCIVLIAEPPKTSKYGVLLHRYSAKADTPTSVVVPSTDEPDWLLRGGDTIAYRVVRDPFLKSVVEAVGPVIAPSANPEGMPPARSTLEAEAYFGSAVDCYVDGGVVPESVQASRIIQIGTDESVTELRTRQPVPPFVPKTHHSSGGVVIYDGKVLLIHWAPPRDSYDFPKGAIENGETSEQACIREVFEETGYKTRIVRYIDSNEFDFQMPNGEWARKLNDYYLLELADESLHEASREPHETFENVWVPIEKAEAMITRDINVDIFKKALKS